MPKRFKGHPDLFDHVPQASPMPEGWRPTPPPELNGETRIYMDAETTGLKWWDGDLPVGWAWFLPESGRQGYTNLRHRGVENVSPEAMRRWFNALRGVHIENLNTRFDLHMAESDGADQLLDFNSFGDVGHQAALLDDNRIRFNLEDLSRDLLQLQEAKIKLALKDKSKIGNLAPWDTEPYALRDVELVGCLHDVMRDDLEDQDLIRVLELEQAIIKVVVEMERNGTYIDMDLLARWKDEVPRRIEAILWDVYQSTGVMLESPDSPKGLVRVFQALGIQNTATTATGLPSFTAAVMKKFAAVSPVIAKLVEAGQLADLNSKYVLKYWRAVRQSDGWLRFNLNQLPYQRPSADGAEGGAGGAVSGRFSASGDDMGGYNPQQVVAVEKQLERGWCTDFVVRRLFTAGSPDELRANPELRISACDMMQVEYRLFAHYANDPQVISVYKDNPLADYHKVVMELLHRVAPHLNRKLVKNTNFAKIYGAGLLKFAYMIGQISEEDYKRMAAWRGQPRWFNKVLNDEACHEAMHAALEVNNAYDEMFPSVKPMLDLAGHTAETRGYVMTLLGRRARLVTRFHSALNRIIQGGAADINKRVLVEVYKLRRKLGFKMMLTVHDELVGATSAPLTELEKVLNTQYFDLRVPILWDCHAGRTWADCK